MALDADVGHLLRARRGDQVANVVQEGGEDGGVVAARLCCQVRCLQAVLCFEATA